MKLINHVYNVTSISVARAATVKSNRVEWDSSTYVEYALQGNMVVIRSIHTGIGEWETIYFSDSFNKLKDRYKDLVAAAMVALNQSTAKVGESLVTFIYNPSVVIVEEERRKPEALTDQPYAISGHRIEKDPRREETRVNINIPSIEVKGKGGWLLGVGIGLAVVAGIAVAASRN